MLFTWYSKILKKKHYRTCPKTCVAIAHVRKHGNMRVPPSSLIQYTSKNMVLLWNMPSNHDIAMVECQKHDNAMVQKYDIIKNTMVLSWHMSTIMSEKGISVVKQFTHSFSSRVIQTTSLTPGLLAFSLEQRCRFQVATRTTGFPSRVPAGGSTQGRTEVTSGGPPSGTSISSLRTLKDVGLGCVKPPFVFVEGVLERSTNTWKRIRSSKDEFMLATLTRSSMFLNGPCTERNSTMFLAIFSVMPRTLMSCGGVAVFMFTPVHGRCSCSLRRDEGEWLDELFLLDTQISSLIASNLVAPTPLTSARSSTFLNPPMHSRYSTMFWATPRFTPGRVMSSSSVAVLMFSRSWFTSMLLKLHAALNLRLPWQKSVGSLGMDRWHPRFPPMCLGDSVRELRMKPVRIQVAHRLILIFELDI